VEAVQERYSEKSMTSIPELLPSMYRGDLEMREKESCSLHGAGVLKMPVRVDLAGTC
jgi:hypothetical protein